MRSVDEGLHDSVVRDGDRGMSPFEGTLHDRRGVNHGVHIAHLRMTMKLHALFGSIVKSLDPRVNSLADTLNLSDPEFLRVPVVLRVARNAHEGSLLQLFDEVGNVLRGNIHPDSDGIVKIRDVEGDDCLRRSSVRVVSVIPTHELAGLHGKYLSLHDHGLVRVGDRRDRRDDRVIEGFAEDQVGIIRIFAALLKRGLRRLLHRRFLLRLDDDILRFVSFPGACLSSRAAAHKLRDVLVRVVNALRGIRLRKVVRLRINNAQLRESVAPEFHPVRKNASETVLRSREEAVPGQSHLHLSALREK